MVTPATEKAGCWIAQMLPAHPGVCHARSVRVNCGLEANADMRAFLDAIVNAAGGPGRENSAGVGNYHRGWSAATVLRDARGR